MVLDDTTALAELVDGAVAATIGATGATLVYAQRIVSVRFRARWALALWRPVAQAIADLAVLAGVLMRALARGERTRGSLRTVSFEPGGDAAERAGRRALATAAGSFAPNTIVLDIDEAGGLMLVHQLVSKPGKRASVDPMGLG
jgi:hypothetical protein